MNKRFFTCSRVFLAKRRRRAQSFWIYVGSYHYLDLLSFALEFLESIGAVLAHNGETWYLEFYRVPRIA